MSEATTIARYQVNTYNDAVATENLIHSDEMAKKYGFTGGLVPGVTVFGHMTYGGVTPLPQVLPVLLFKHRGNLNRGSAVESVRYANAQEQPELMDEFERSARHPVGIGKLVKPAELHMDHIVHELDVRRPLGLATEWNADDLHAALDAAVVTKSPLIAPAKTAIGLRLVATDLNWSYGPPDAVRVEGPAEDLLLALCGRPIGLATLAGNGVTELAERINR